MYVSSAIRMNDNYDIICYHRKTDNIMLILSFSMPSHFYLPLISFLKRRLRTSLKKELNPCAVSVYLFDYLFINLNIY